MTVTTNPYGHTTFFFIFFLFFFSKNVFESQTYRLDHSNISSDTRFELRKVAHSLTHVKFMIKLKFLFDKNFRPVHSWIRIQNLFYKNVPIHG